MGSPTLRTDGLGGAVLQVVPEQKTGRGAQRLLHRGDLDDDVGAVALVLDHFFDPADLSFGLPQPNDGLFSDVRIRDMRLFHVFDGTPRGYEKSIECHTSVRRYW